VSEKKTQLVLACALLVLGAWFFSVHAQTTSTTGVTSTTSTSPGQTATTTDTQAERAALEAQLADLENQIEQQQQQISKYQAQGSTLSGEIRYLNSKISQINLQIKAVNLKLTQLSSDITDTQSQINQTENQINVNKDALASSIQAIYESDNQNLLEILLANNNLSDFFSNVDNIILAQSNMRDELDQIQKLRDQLVAQQQTLTGELSDTQNFKNIQTTQKFSLQTTQSQKTTLLKQTRGQEATYQKILAKTKETAAQIRNRIFQLLGGGQLTFQQAYNYAKLAEGATGVRAALILAILNRESALGQNVGKCSYTTAMNPTRDVPIFLKLLQSLNIDPGSQSAYVSCPNSDGAYGGAMGPAQFIPSTWNLYASQISQITGDSPANPWNNSDAFVATGLLMKDLLSSANCINYAKANQKVAPYQTLLERCAAAKYYAGGNWYTYRFWYGQPVVDQANNYQNDIDVLNSQGS
jgi:peptidoglycan hydrolase CwlO-like protein